MTDDRCKPLQGASTCSWCKRWQLGYELHKRRLNTKIHLAVDANGMPVRVLITEGTRADCKEAIHLIEGISAESLLADRGYDINSIALLFHLLYNPAIIKNYLSTEVISWIIILISCT